jgi:hemerythrin
MRTVAPKELLEWNEEFSVEVEELDDHHRELIRLINELHEILDCQAESQKVSEVISKLFDYANYHFGAEEALFSATIYPFAQEHREKHLEFREHLAELRDMIEAEIGSARSNLLSYLHSWWTNHIMEEDKEYSPYLKG